MPAKKRLVPPIRPNADGTGFVRVGRPGAAAPARNRSGGPRRAATPSSSSGASSAASTDSRASGTAAAAAVPSRGRPGRSSEVQNCRQPVRGKNHTTVRTAPAITTVLTTESPVVASTADKSDKPSEVPMGQKKQIPAPVPHQKMSTASKGSTVLSAMDVVVPSPSPASASSLSFPAAPPVREVEIGIDAALGPSECLAPPRLLHQLGMLSGAVMRLSTSYSEVVAEARQMSGVAASEKLYVNDDMAAVLVDKRVCVSPIPIEAAHGLPVLTSLTLRPVPPEDTYGSSSSNNAEGKGAAADAPPVLASLSSTLDWQAMFRRALHHKIAYVHLRTTQRVLTQRLTLEVVKLTSTCSSAADAVSVRGSPSPSSSFTWGVVTDATLLHLESGATDSLAREALPLSVTLGKDTASAPPEAALCVLVVGESGTGKSRWLKKLGSGQLTSQDVPKDLQCLLAVSGSRHIEWVRVEELPQGEGSEVSTATALRESFERVRQSAPAVLLIDDLHVICARETSSAGSRWAMSLIAHTLAEELLDLQQHHHDVWVVASAPSLDSLDGCLTGTSLFGEHVVSLGMPAGPTERLACLRTCLVELSAKRITGGGTATTLQRVSDECLREVAERAHGFTQRDVHRLAETAVVKAFQTRQSVVPEDADLRAAAAVVHPSSLKRFEVSAPNVTWDDIGGSAEAKRTLCEVVEWCLGKQSWIFTEFNLTPPKGVLLYGPPGCSKTMLAKALANESHMNFISVKGPEVFSKWVGDSEKAVRDIFERARAASPCVVFIDELDGMCGHRGRGGVSDRVISQFLTELDGLPAAFEKKNALVFVAATNRPDSIDGAVLRPGRIDRRVYVGLPSYDERAAITAIQFRHIPVAAALTAAYVADRTEGYTGAEVVAVVKEAAFHAITTDAQAACVTLADIDAALLKVRPRIQAKDVEWYKSWPHSTPTLAD